MDFDYIFANMDFNKNATLYATEIAIVCLFILLFIWARRKDVKDIEMLGVTPLQDNKPEDEYLYEVIVGTGRRRGAGTDSRVCFILSGEFGETTARLLRDPYRKVLQRGNYDRFLLACPRPLGKLIYLRLWHDNSGRGDTASWYCNYVGIVDLQTREKSHFIVDRWFGVDEDDGLIDRLIPVSSSEELLAFTHLFTGSISRDLSEDHLWISVLARPATSRFTRVERVACCLLLLFLTMLTSCMFYKDEGAEKQPSLFVLGPFAFTLQEVFVAVITNVITFVPMLLITYLYRNSRLYSSHSKFLRTVVEDHLDEEIDSVPSDRLVGDENGSSPSLPKPKKRIFLCPWQLRILAWILVILGLAASALFTTFYGISFGNAQCQKWLSSLFLSFFASVLIAQPIKVILLAILFSLICKKTNVVDDIEIADDEDVLIEGLGKRYQLKLDEEYMHNEYLLKNFKPQKLVILPPDPVELERIRIYRLKQKRANDIIREIIFYSIFLALLLMVTLSFRDANGYRLKLNLENMFFGEEFERIHSADDFYNWVNNTLITNLRAKRWYNQDPALYQRGYLDDRTDRIIGYAIMRQLRVKPKSCNVYELAKPFIANCYGSYDMFSQDEEAYGVGWVPFVGNSRKNNSMDEFRYTSSSDLDGIPYMGQITWYSGGGYAHLLRGSEEVMRKRLDYLKSVHWVDFSTRAIVIQFTVYNPNVNLFGIITALVESPGLGTMLTSYRIETANLFGSVASLSSVFELGTQIAYILVLFGYIIKEIRNICKQKGAYLREPWNYLEMFIIIGSFAAIAAYIYMVVATKDAIAEFSRTHGNIFMNFQFLAYWNEALTYLLALICFCATMKLIRLFRFNQRVGLLGSVLKYAFRDLKYFFIVFSVIFLAFVIVFYLLYADTLRDFRNFLSAMETSFQIILGKFDFTAMYERELVLGPLMFAVFTLFVIFIVVSMFIAILDESFQKVMNDIRLQSDEYEMTYFILYQLLHWTGLNRTAWGKNMADRLVSQPEPVYCEDSERELSMKLKELSSMMDEFLGYIQLNYLEEQNPNESKLSNKSL